MSEAIITNGPNKDLYFVAVKVFLRKENKLLITKDKFGDWDIPGGRLRENDFNTPLEKVVERKMSEELGDSLNYELGEPIIFMRHERDELLSFKEKEKRRIFAVGYKAEYINGDINLGKNHEKYEWVDITKLRPENYFTGGWLKGITEFQNRFRNQTHKNNYAFIDGQNLYLAIQELGWKLDYKRFRTYLKEKYQIKKAYMFMGFIPTNKDLYDFLKSVGYELVFKPILESTDYKIKGNCDAELVMQSMIDIQNYNQAMLVTGDGDFHCLIQHLNTRNKLLKVLAPSTKNCSSLVKKAAQKRISFVSDLKAKLEYKKKRTP